ncbi:hypothetical protein [Protofrankia coriariae]|uniref:hypothetical protein n=1 Tax=Protofrankia coriariae TaxID=1562887 RepID=UPI0012F69A7C|nr:hypothetical protein [Protofrankia coriariae]
MVGRPCGGGRGLEREPSNPRQIRQTVRGRARARLWARGRGGRRSSSGRPAWRAVRAWVRGREKFGKV